MPDSLQIAVDPTQDAVIAALSAAAIAFGDLMGESCEVVVHDLRIPDRSIVAIVNGHVTGRVEGGPLVGGPFGDVALKWLTSVGERVQHDVYETRTRGGRRLKSATTLYRDAFGRPYAALCVNFDVSELAAFLEWGQRIQGVRRVPPPAIGDPSNVDDVLEATIGDVIGPYRDVLGTLTRDTRLDIVRDLDARGVFLIRGSVRRIADELRVSKYTIYNDLEEIRAK